MKSCIYQGVVRHRRFAPVEHAFRYRLFMMYVDLAELDEVFRGRWLWSVGQPNVASFRRSDYLGDAGAPLDDAVRDEVEAQLGRRPRGPIRMLTHLRYFGYCMNPVTFYYCWNEADDAVDAIVAEIQNTPWAERHRYVLDRRRDGKGDEHRANGAPIRRRFDKAFHISPFMGMQQQYDWRLSQPAERLLVHMDNFERGEKLFDATLLMQRKPITGGNLARVLTRHPLMTVRVVAGIYFQALRLWWKRCPFYPHPKHATPSEGVSS